MAVEPIFFYDLASPYAYLAALRVDEVLPVRPRWRPVVLAALHRAHQRVPWSLREDEREPGQVAVSERGEGRGLPPMRWPPGWPAESYSVLPLRAALWALDALGHDQGKALTLALYEAEFREGRALNDLDTVLEAATRCGVAEDELRAGVQEESVKTALHSVTGEAVGMGVPGVPTVVVGEALFWGDDRLEEAASALRAA